MDNFHRKVETTADGSVTFYIPEIDEHYHSTNGAITEAELVYINNAFIHRNKKDIHLLEIGFGTGLNAFLTFIKARKENIKVHYTTIELYPLSEDKISMLNYPQLISPEDLEFFIKMHTCEWGKPVNISDNFVIEKREIDLTKSPLTGNFDVVYFDAFAPEKQPEMWNDEIYKKVVDSMNTDGVLTTYCAKGVVRRGFRDAGLTMERLPGPPGKREMLRGTKSIV